MKLVIAKRHKQGRFYEAVVMDTDAKNEVLWALGLSFNAHGKEICQNWIDTKLGRWRKK